MVAYIGKLEAGNPTSQAAKNQDARLLWKMQNHLNWRIWSLSLSLALSSFWTRNRGEVQIRQLRGRERRTTTKQITMEGRPFWNQHFIQANAFISIFIAIEQRPKKFHKKEDRSHHQTQNRRIFDAIQIEQKESMIKINKRRYDRQSKTMQERKSRMEKFKKIVK